MNPHSALMAYRFNVCVVDTALREVRLSGVVQPVAPRVFDLLIYLLRHRDRVVTREELVDNVWSGAILSDSALARAVMKARRAIGDTIDASGKSALIRTVHRIGYRFSEPSNMKSNELPSESEIRVVGATETVCDSSTTNEPRLAILPFDDRTDDRRLSWIELGLMSLVTRALEVGKQAQVTPVADVLTALQAARLDDAEITSKAEALSQLIGVHCVCGVSVTKNEIGFGFNYHLVYATGLQFRGSLDGVELTTLCRQLTRRIEAHFCSGIAGGEPVLHTNDPWVNQAYVRALHAIQLQKPVSAMKLLRVIIDLEPRNNFVRHALLECLSQLGSPEAHALGEELLQEAKDSGNLRRAAEVHQLLATAQSHLEGETEATKYHVEQSLILAGRGNSSYWAQHIYSRAADAAQRMGDFDTALILYEQVELACQASGNQLQRLISISSRAVIEALRGNLLTAHELWNTCLHELAPLQQRSRVMLLHCNLSELCASMGLLEVAMRHADAVLDLIPESQVRWFNLQCLAMICVRYAERRRLDKIDQALTWSDVLMRDLNGRDVVNARVAVAQRHACLGEFDFAAQELQGAMEVVIARQDVEYASMYAPVLIYNEMRAGRYERAQQAAKYFLATKVMNTSTDVAGLLLHAKAHAQHEHGNVVEARQSLAEAIAAMHPGRWYILARLDAAWLDIERLDIDAARRSLIGTFSWIQKHPIGQLVDARFQLALGNRDKSLMGLDRVSGFFEASEVFVQQLRQNCQCHWQSPPPVASRLPSVM